MAGIVGTLRGEGAWARLEWALFGGVDAASLRAFRLLFGALCAVSAARFLAMGWVEALYIAPTTHFSYPGFGWVKPLPGAWMYAPFGVMVAAGVGVALGWWYRWSVAAYLLCFLYVELIDPSYYLNHYYFMSLVLFGMLWVPLGRGGPARVPGWALWALRAQVGCVYFFAGVAKLNPDWLGRAEPLRTWLAVRALDWPQPWGGWLAVPEVAYAMSYAGALFDLTIPLWLLWRRTRLVAYGAVVVFHGVTGALFQIGIFPWVMALTALVFFPADWPKRVGAALRGAGERVGAPVGVGAGADQGADAAQGALWGTRRARAWAAGVLAIYFGVQVALPLRHHLYPGDLLWTEEGFSYAWHVMVMEKGGQADFWVEDARTGRRWLVDPDAVLDPIQAKVVATNPELMRQFAHILAARFRAQGYPEVAVFARARASLNGHPARALIRPDVDLSREPWRWGPAPWIAR